MLKGLQAVLPAMELLVQMYVNQFVYSASTASNSRQDDDFKLQLQTFYHNALDEQQCQLRCMLLNVQLPMTLVTGKALSCRSFPTEGGGIIQAKLACVTLDSCIFLTVYSMSIAQDCTHCLVHSDSKPDGAMRPSNLPLHHRLLHICLSSLHAD